MGDPDSFDLEQAALLDADSIPNDNQSYSCFSCGEDMTGIYCYACGNKNDNYRRSIWSLGAELFASLTAFEGRIWRSLRSLIFKPGEMARGFADGARQKWTSPIRVYLAMSLILFGYVAVSKTQLVAFGTQNTISSNFDESGENVNFTPKLHFLERKSKLQNLVTDETITALENEFKNILKDDDQKTIEELNADLERQREALAKLDAQIANPPSPYAVPGMTVGRQAVLERITEIETELAKREEGANVQPANNENTEDEDAMSEFFSGFVDGATGNDENETELDSIAKDDDEKEDKSGTEDTSIVNITDMEGNEFKLDAAGLREAGALALRYPERVNAPLNKWLPRIMFFMMPFSMLMGAIFIRGRETAMLYDHLVHAAYIHAFSFLLLFIFILLVQYTPIPGLLFVYMVILLIYLPLSAKRMFRRSWFKTILTSYGVGLIYTMFMGLILAILIIMGILDIAKDVAQARAT